MSPLANVTRAVIPSSFTFILKMQVSDYQELTVITLKEIKQRTMYLFVLNNFPSVTLIMYYSDLNLEI